MDGLRQAAAPIRAAKKASTVNDIFSAENPMLDSKGSQEHEQQLSSGKTKAKKQSGYLSLPVGSGEAWGTDRAR